MKIYSYEKTIIVRDNIENIFPKSLPGDNDNADVYVVSNVPFKFF